jgi:peroxiredoxin
MIQTGEKLPDATLFEFVEDARAGCTLGPNSFDVREQTAGKRVVIFGLPGAFTPTCSANMYRVTLSMPSSCALLASTRSGACPSTTRS